MTIQASPSEQSYATDGVSTVFAIPFPFDTAADLKLTSTDSAGNILTLTTGFTISGGGGSTGNATFTVAPAAGLTLTIYDDPALTQPTNYVSLDAFPAESHEKALDRVTRIAKRLRQLVQRSVRFPDGDVSTDGVLGSVANRKGKYLFFNAVTGAIEYAANIVTTTLSQSIIGQLLNPQTTAEVAAGVLPTNYFHAPGNVLRYGAIGNSVTNDAPAFQKAINVSRNGGGAVVVPASPSGGAYLLTSMLDCTYAGSANTPTFAFRGESSSPAGGFPAILAKHTQTAIFDCTGSYGVLWTDFQVRCDPVTFPKVGWLLARNSTGSSQLHKFRGVSVQGWFSDTVVYNYGSEQEIYEGCFFYNNATGTATNVLTWTQNNYKAYTSSFVTIKVAPASTTIHQIFGGSFGNTGANAAGNVFYLEGVCDGVKAYGPWTTAGGCQAIVYADMSGGAGSCPNFCEFDGITVETGGVAYGVLFSNHANTPSGWTLNNWKSTAATYFLSAGVLATLDNFSIKHLSEVVTKGINVPGTLQNSTVDVVTILVAGIALRSLLIGINANFTITTNTNSIIIDKNTGAILTRGGIGMWGNTAAAQLTGWGTPGAGAVINNFPGSAATLVQCGQAMTEVILQLKALGLFGA